MTHSVVRTACAWGARIWFNQFAPVEDLYRAVAVGAASLVGGTAIVIELTTVIPDPMSLSYSEGIVASTTWWKFRGDRSAKRNPRKRIPPYAPSKG